MVTQPAKHSKGPKMLAVGTGDENVSLTPAQFTERMATRFCRKDRTRIEPSKKSLVASAFESQFKTCHDLLLSTPWKRFDLFHL